MERKRVAGRFVRESLNGDGNVRPSQSKSGSGGLGAKQSRSLARKTVAKALPEIVDRFVEEAKKGSVAHAKMLTALGGLDKSEPAAAVGKRRGKSPVGLLVERIAKEPEA